MTQVSFNKMQGGTVMLVGPGKAWFPPFAQGSSTAPHRVQTV
jgi:hypothetical protein